MDQKRFDTSGFVQERAHVLDADRSMVFGPAAKPGEPAVMTRLVMLGMREQGTAELAELAARRLGLVPRVLPDDATPAQVVAACAEEATVVVPPLASLRDAGVRDALRACKVYHVMVNPARFAAERGLAGEAGEEFCREAMELDALCLSVMQHPLADGKTPAEMLENVLETLGIRP